MIMLFSSILKALKEFWAAFSQFLNNNSGVLAALSVICTIMIWRHETKYKIKIEQIKQDSDKYTLRISNKGREPITISKIEIIRYTDNIYAHYSWTSDILNIYIAPKAAYDYKVDSDSIDMSLRLGTQLLGPNGQALPYYKHKRKSLKPDRYGIIQDDIIWQVTMDASKRKWRCKAILPHFIKIPPEEKEKRERLLRAINEVAKNTRHDINSIFNGIDEENEDDQT